MKAAICYEFGKPLVIEEVDIDPPKKGEVKVRLSATAICHSDIHNIRGDWGGEDYLPLVAGHESSGVVEEVGEGVTLVKPGDAVVPSLLPFCGRCYYCVNGYPHLCEFKWPLDTESRLRNKQGQRLNLNRKMANFAEYMIAHESQLVKIPDDMPKDCAALLACGVVTGFCAVVNRMQVRPFSSVVVIGTGGVGVNSLQGASYSGAYPVIAVDTSEDRLKLATQFGATHALNAGKEDVIQAVTRLTSGRGADFVFVTVGNIQAIQQGVTMSGPRGTTVIIGVPPIKEGNLSFHPMEFLEGEKVLTAAAMGSLRPSVDIPRLVKLYQTGHLKLKELITGRFPFEKINDAIESSEKGEGLRNIVVF